MPKSYAILFSSLSLLCHGLKANDSGEKMRQHNTHMKHQRLAVIFDQDEIQRQQRWMARKEREGDGKEHSSER